MVKGKSIGEYLKDLRRQMAEANVMDCFSIKSLFGGDWLKRKLGMLGISLVLVFGVACASKAVSLSGSHGKNQLTQKEDSIYVFVEKKPEFPGGNNALMAFLSKNIKYPEEALEKSIQGKVVVSFVVEKDGTLSQKKVEKSVHPLLDAEAMRVVSSMPKWIPGERGGKVVRSRYVLPFGFKCTVMPETDVVKEMKED